jgi:Flp pilus assembly protein TadD
LRPADPTNKSAAPSKVKVRLGDWAKVTLTPEQRARLAIEQHRAAVAANPDDAKACNGLAWAYVTAPGGLRDVKAALPLAEKALRLAPDNPDHRNTLGVAYYRADRFREAVETLRPNVERQADKGLAIDLHFLAMSYHRLGETVRAKDYFDWAVRWTKAQTGLSAANVEELNAFRAEAEALLSRKEKK